MPAKGTTKISNQTKAKILAEKRVGMGTAQEIADKYNVAAQTVRNIGMSNRPIPADVLDLAAKLENRILKQAKTNLEIGLEEIGNRITDRQEKLSAIVQAVRFCYDVHLSSAVLLNPIDEKVKNLVKGIQHFAQSKDIPFEEELQNFIQNFSHMVDEEVRARLDMIWLDLQRSDSPGKGGTER